MKLFELEAAIKLDSSDFDKGLAASERTAKDFAGSVSATTIAAGQLIADVTRKAVSSLTNVIKTAYNNYSDYEQLVGGVETLFANEYADASAKVIKNSREAYKTAGISANEYMSTVTSFSASLMQGLGGDVDAAAELANTAIIDMADNANKFGTDMRSIQNAYMGFAKSNFTMLDNLKLGYGGTAGEMVRLINDSGILKEEIKDLDGITFDQMIAAIHAVQEKLGVSGTTAAEAGDTLAGSFAAVKAAWANMLTDVGSGNVGDIEFSADAFEQAFETFAGNALPAAIRTAASAGSVVEAISNAITSIPANGMAKLVSAGFSSFGDLVTSAGEIFEWLVNGIGDQFEIIAADQSKVQEFGRKVGTAVGSSIATIVQNAPAIVSGLFAGGVALASSLVDGLLDGLFGENSEADRITEGLNNELSTIEVQTTKASGLISYMQSLIDKYGTAATETTQWKEAVNDLDEIIGGSKQYIDEHTGSVEDATAALKKMNEELRITAIQQAMEGSLKSAYDLLGQQTVERDTALYIAGSRQAMIDEALKPMADVYKTLMAEYLDRRQKYIDQEGLDNYGYISGIGDVEHWQEFTGEGVSYQEFMGYIQNLQSGISDFLEEGEIPIWEKDMADKMLSPEQFAAIQENVNVWSVEMQQANERAAEYSKQIEATNKTIDTLNAVIAQNAEKAGASISSAGDIIAGAANNAAHKIAALGGNDFIPHATGLDYVPFDGYLAELHRGEAILTAAEANTWRRGSNGGLNYDLFGAAMGAAIEDAMGRVNVYLGAEKVGNLTTHRVNKNIRADSNARLRGMGG